MLRRALGFERAQQWVDSYVADDKTYCVYLAETEDTLREDAELSGFPADRIIEVRRTIDPNMAAARVWAGRSASLEQRPLAGYRAAGIHPHGIDVASFV